MRRGQSVKSVKIRFWIAMQVAVIVRELYSDFAGYQFPVHFICKFS